MNSGLRNERNKTSLHGTPQAMLNMESGDFGGASH